MEVKIPGRGSFTIEHLVMDFNGTIACDGKLVEGIEEAFFKLKDKLTMHVITSDTYGTVGTQCSHLPVNVTALKDDDHTAEKKEYVSFLSAEKTAAVGNGANDAEMLKEAVLSVAVLKGEGCAFKAAAAADILVCDINEALELFLKPKRITATLRK